jgi:SynChlorMet cassette protein ScmC
MNDPIKFPLRLANGHKWQLIGFDSCEVWLHELASLLRLSPTYSDSNGFHRLIFVDSGLWTPNSTARPPGLDCIDTGMPESSWACRNLGAVKIWTHPDSTDVICQRNSGRNRDIRIIQMWMALDPVYSRAVECGGLPLHAGLLERNAQAVLLAGPGGMGKSSCCRRVSLPWQSHCDDETLVVKVGDAGFMVHPFPTWSEYLGKESCNTWDVQRSFPVKGIFFLRQGPTDSVESIGPARAAMFMYHSALDVLGKNIGEAGPGESRALRTKVFESACGLARQIPAFILQVSPEGKFWEEIERSI